MATTKLLSTEHTHKLGEAKRQWDAELAEWNELFEAYHRIEKLMKRQRERISEAYKRYKELGGK